MQDTWNEIIFSNINEKLQASAMKLVHDERAGESFYNIWNLISYFVNIEHF